MKAACEIVLASGLLVFGSAVTSGQAQVNTGSSGAVFPGEGVTGRPYCAMQEVEAIQSLIDGTHITHKSKTKICRDSQGRIRTETFGADAQASTPLIVDIADPVDHVRYVLDVNSHVAHRIVQPLPPPVGRQLPWIPLTPGKQGPETTTEHLESQIMEDLLVEGTRTTTTVPVGAQGNDRPIVTVMETWFSQELGTVVLLKQTSPRIEMVQRLTNIDRSEPDPALFRVPADYTVEDAPGAPVPR